MKKLLMILVSFLAIAGSTAAQTQISFTERTIPGADTITALCVTEDYFLAFSNGGNKGYKILFNPYRVETLKYDTAKVPRTVRDAKETIDGRIVIVGDNSLTRVSSDNGKTWDDIITIKMTDRSFRLFIDKDGTEEGNVWFFIPDKIRAFSFYTKYSEPGGMNPRDYFTNGLTIINGFSIGEKAMFIASDKNSAWASSFYSITQDVTLRYNTNLWTLDNKNDLVLSSLKKYETIRIITRDTKSLKGSSYSINTTEVLYGQSTDAILPGDKFVENGHVYPAGDGYFFGVDENERPIKINLDMERTYLDCGLKVMTKLSGKDKKVVIGSINGLISISDPITRVEKNFEKDIFIVQSNNQLEINGVGEDANWETNWEIYSSVGNLILSGQGTKISKNFVPAGMYLIKIKVEGNEIVKKIIM